MNMNLLASPLPPAEELEKMWLRGELPPGVLPPLTLLNRNYAPVDEIEQIPDDTKRFEGTFY